MNAKIKRLLSLICLAGGVFQVQAQQFTPQVKKFIEVDTSSFALADVKIVDGTGGPVKDHQTILVTQGRITAVGPTGKITLPSGTQVISCTGKTVIPGMVMMHEHLFYGEPVGPYYLGMAMPFSFPQLYLAGGVTTLRTAGTVEAQTDINTRDFIKAGKMIGPDIDVTGPYIEREGFPIPEVSFIRSPEEAAATVNYWADKGCTSFKVYQDITRADLKAVLKAAHKRGIKVTGHLCSVTFREAAAAGIDNLEHGFLVSSDFDPHKKEDVCSGTAQVFSLAKLDKDSPAVDSLIDFLISKKVALPQPSRSSCLIRDGNFSPGEPTARWLRK